MGRRCIYATMKRYCIMYAAATLVSGLLFCQTVAGNELPTVSPRGLRSRRTKSIDEYDLFKYPSNDETSDKVAAEKASRAGGYYGLETSYDDPPNVGATQSAAWGKTFFKYDAVSAPSSVAESVSSAYRQASRTPTRNFNVATQPPNFVPTSEPSLVVNTPTSTPTMPTITQLPQTTSQITPHVVITKTIVTTTTTAGTQHPASNATEEDANAYLYLYKSPKSPSWWQYESHSISNSNDHKRKTSKSQKKEKSHKNKGKKKSSKRHSPPVKSEKTHAPTHMPAYESPEITIEMLYGKKDSEKKKKSGKENKSHNKLIEPLATEFGILSQKYVSRSKSSNNYKFYSKIPIRSPTVSPVPLPDSPTVLPVVTPSNVPSIDAPSTGAPSAPVRTFAPFPVARPPTSAPVTQSPTANGNRVQLAPFSLFYDISQSTIPLESEVQTVVVVTDRFVEQYFKRELDGLDRITVELEDREFAFNEPYRIDFSSTALFDPGVTAPSQFQLNQVLSEIFSGESLELYVQQLQGLSNNVFSTINQVEELSSSRERSRFSVRASIASAACVFAIMVSGIFLYRKKQSIRYGGKPINPIASPSLAGDTYVGSSTLYTESVASSHQQQPEQVLRDAASISNESEQTDHWGNSVRDDPMSEEHNAFEVNDESSLQSSPYLEDDSLPASPSTYSVLPIDTAYTCDNDTFSADVGCNDSTVTPDDVSEDANVPMRVVDLIKRFSLR